MRSGKSVEVISTLEEMLRKGFRVGICRPGCLIYAEAVGWDLPEGGMTTIDIVPTRPLNHFRTLQEYVDSNRGRGGKPELRVVK